MRLLPDDMVTISHAYLQSATAMNEYPVDNLWMSRAAMELIPLTLYQRIVFGDHSLVTRGIGNLYESAVLAPYDPTPAAAKWIFEHNVRYIPEAVEYDGYTGLADALSPEGSAYTMERGLWKLRNVGMTVATMQRGLLGCGTDIICLKYRDPMVDYSSQLDGLKMPYANSPIYQQLLDQHNGTPLGVVIGNPWSDD
jgi:hypothetical protein